MAVFASNQGVRVGILKSSEIPYSRNLVSEIMNFRVKLPGLLIQRTITLIQYEPYKYSTYQ